ncbi:MAG: amidohydrolase family protein, partial [Ectothiorhodospira sp.]
LPLTLRLVEEGVLPLLEAVRRITRGPAEILGMPLGTLAPGTRADLILVDPERPYTPAAERWYSAGQNSPFLHWRFRGRVTHTLASGRVIHETAGRE